MQVHVACEADAKAQAEAPSVGPLVLVVAEAEAEAVFSRLAFARSNALVVAFVYRFRGDATNGLVERCSLAAAEAKAPPVGPLVLVVAVSVGSDFCTRSLFYKTCEIDIKGLPYRDRWR